MGKRVRYRVGDIVLVRSIAGSSIPNIHVKLLERVEMRPTKGIKFDWPGYSGWHATPIYQKEIEILRKKWSIPFKKANKDLTFVFDDDILKRVKE